MLDTAQHTSYRAASRSAVLADLAATSSAQHSPLSRVRKNNSTQATKMPSTPQMRKANEKNAKNILKRGNVTKSSKSDDKYPVSPELIVSITPLRTFEHLGFITL